MELDTLYAVSIERLNAIAAQGSLTSIHIAHAYRLELKTTLRLMRQLIATEQNQEVREIRSRQLRCLKRIHYNLIIAEACSIELAKRNN